MTLEEIKQELLEQGKDPNDFNITIKENEISITPKWYYETKQIAKIEDLKLSSEVFYDIMQVESKAESLENENAQLWFENMTLDKKVDEETAVLWFEIMTGGM